MRPCWGLCSCPQGVGFGARHLARGQMQLSKTRGNPFPLSLSFRNCATTWPAAGALAGTVEEPVRGVCECACVGGGGGAQGYQHPWLSPLGTCGRCCGPRPLCPLLLQVSIRAEPRPRITDSAALSLGVQATATARFPSQGPSRGLPAWRESGAAPHASLSPAPRVKSPSLSTPVTLSSCLPLFLSFWNILLNTLSWSPWAWWPKPVAWPSLSLPVYLPQPSNVVSPSASGPGSSSHPLWVGIMNPQTAGPL